MKIINKTKDDKLTNSKAIVYCAQCKNKIIIYKSFLKENQKYFYCSNKCKKLHFQKIFKGSNNPNYHNTWSKEQKDNQSEKIKQIYIDDPTLRFRVSKKGIKKPNLSKKLKQYYKTHKSIMYGKKHTDETKNLIGKKSKQKFTQEYKNHTRKLFEDRGYWIPLKDKTDFQIYYNEANWIQKMFNYITDKNQLQLLKQYGVFNSKTNINGVVRDHIYSRKSGFQNGVFPELLRHPANCQLLTNSNNIRKKKMRYVDADWQTLDQLFDKIINYSNNWCEQELCKKLIEEYKIGKRWTNKYKES